MLPYHGGGVCVAQGSWVKDQTKSVSNVKSREWFTLHGIGAQAEEGTWAQPPVGPPPTGGATGVGAVCAGRCSGAEAKVH